MLELLGVHKSLWWWQFELLFHLILQNINSSMQCSRFSTIFEQEEALWWLCELQGEFKEWSQTTILFLPVSGEWSTFHLTENALGHVWLICYKVIKNYLYYCSAAWFCWNKHSGWRWVAKLEQLLSPVAVGRELAVCPAEGFEEVIAVRGGDGIHGAVAGILNVYLG